MFSQLVVTVYSHTVIVYSRGFGVNGFSLGNEHGGRTRENAAKSRKNTEDIRMGLDRNAVSWVRAFGCLTLAFLCFLMLPSRYAFGQVDEGAISGTVQDSTGAVVANARVILLNTDQGITLETKTNSSGEYFFSPVRIGHYSVSVTAKGFSKTTQQNLTVTVAQHLLVNVQLKVGAATETVEVTTAPPLLQTEEASVGQVVSSESVNSLPLNGRNFTFLAQLGAGMQTPQADTRGNAASGAFSANGLRPAQNNYLLDGIDNNSNAVDFLNGTNFVILPPLDAIQEFKVQTADFSAELGRSAGAVLNATIKSGTNSLHGAVWEFFRNDKLDAADWFEDNNGVKKGELRLNQFGASGGGPIIKNKLFFFGDYEGKRRVQGTSFTSTVPTATERSSNYTNLADILTQNDGTTRTDILGRAIQRGTILDPATTRLVPKGTMDPVSGLTNNTGADGYVRDPFSSKCGPGTMTFTLAACSDLNQFTGANAGRIDQNAVKLLNLYPAPNSGLATYGSSPGLFEHANSFDTREDFNPSAKDQIFFRYSFADDPQYIPGPFGGVADGGAFQQGIQTARSHQMVAAITHVFTPNAINQVRGGFAHLHTTRYGPDGGVDGIPAQYGIQGIPQGQENGGLPNFYIGNLTSLGSNNFLPSDEISQTLQITDDFTKIYGKHSFKMGIEYQNVKFSTLQPAWSRGAFNYGGGFTDIPNVGSTTGGIAQMLIPPAAAPATLNGNPNPNGYDYSGGSDGVYASNINKTYDQKMYFASYFQDDWKVSPKLTINLGLRWDYFGPINETNGGQANFVPASAGPITQPTYIVPASGKDNRTLSTDATCLGVGCRGLVDLLPADGITLLSTNKYGQGLLQTQRKNFAPRVGFAYQVDPKLVVRGGFGLFFNSFENQGYGPNNGENYPFVFNFSYFPSVASGISSQVAPTKYNTPFATCATAGPGGTASFESGFSCIPFDSGQGRRAWSGAAGTSVRLPDPTHLQRQLHPPILADAYLVRPGLVCNDRWPGSSGRRGLQERSPDLPAGTSTQPYLPFKDFGSGSYQATYGSSQYHGLQTKLEQQFSSGLSYLFTYTWSKAMSNAGDLLNGGNTGGLRAYGVPGLGPKFDYAPADFDIRQVVHFSGGYQLPFGKDKRYMNQGGLANAMFGGWAVNWIASLEGGQPLNFGCNTGTTSGTGCNDIRVGNPQLGMKNKTINGALRPFWINNAAAFNQPCQLGAGGAPIPDSPAGCLPLTGAAALGSKPGQTVTPGFHRFDFSTFKAFQLSDRFSMQFRAEFFNILNHPNFNAPNFGGNGVVAIGGSGNITDPHFGEVGSTRDAPFDPRQIQFAMKLYY